MQVCEERWSEPLSAWIDGEAEPEESARVEAHLARCETCTAAVEGYRAIGDAMRAGADARVPARVVARARGLQSVEAAPRERQRTRGPWIAATAVGLAAAALLAVGGPAPGLEEALARDLVGQHLRGFARARPCEIESGDAAVVRDWVETRLGYGVEVPTPEGVELIGARACTIGGQATAALLYRHEGAPMTLFVPPPGSEALASAARFASSGSRCVEGPIGERICVSGAPSQRAFAVADLPEEQVLPLVVR
jgi:anti-sigma factor RsiW